jgi:phenylacetate-CoA ligase
MEKSIKLMIEKLIFKIGELYRNPSLRSQYRFLKESENWSLEQLQLYQLKKLQKLIERTYNHSAFYRERFDAIGFHPSDIKSLDAIKKIPIITKNELIAFNNEIHSKRNFKKLFLASTSGTSGDALTFKREETADSFNRASVFRGYSWYGVKPWERNGYFWGFNFSKFQKVKTFFFDILQNRFRLFSYKTEELHNFLKKLSKASYIHGYSSMIYETAKMMNRERIQKPTNIKLVKGTSEKIVDAYQNEIKKAFGVKMISEYGAAETGIIAFECPKGNMHINMEGVLVEELNNEIIVTNLQLHSFPIIRYKLGDYIQLAPRTKVCECGMKHLILDDVTGRVGALVQGNLANYPSLYFYYIFKNLANSKSLFLNYKVVQLKKGEIIVYLEQYLDNNQLQLLKKELNIYFKNDVKIDIKMGKKIKDMNQKHQSFISKIV